LFPDRGRLFIYIYCVWTECSKWLRGRRFSHLAIGFIGVGFGLAQLPPNICERSPAVFLFSHSVSQFGVCYLDGLGEGAQRWVGRLLRFRLASEINENT